MKLEFDTETFLKTIEGIKLQIVWPYENNLWNKDNVKGIRVSCFRKETYVKTQNAMTFSSA
jgi:hypothetical protein